MKLRVATDPEGAAGNAAVGVGWLSNETALSVGDDRQLRLWSMSAAEPSARVASAYKSTSHPTCMHVLGARAGQLVLVGTSDGRFQLLNGQGLVEKGAEAHEGATLCVRWSADGTGFLTTGEDGAFKTWSRSGMLRNVLTQAGRPIYAADWNADGTRVVYTFGEHCVIMSLKSQGQPTKWKAHEGVVLCLAWSAAVDLIGTGGEDCRYRVFDAFGRPLFASQPHSHPVTALAWSPDGELFAVGSFNLLRLCDRAGWSHSVERRQMGSIYGLAWSLDGTQLGAACASGQVLIGTSVDKRLWWRNIEAVQTESRRIDLRDVLSEVGRERLEVRDRVTRLQLGHAHLVVATTRQLYVFSARNWNTPVVLELRDGNVSLILLCEKYFLLVDGGQAQVFNYEGRQQCSLRPNSHNGTADHLTERIAALSNDVVVFRDRQARHTIQFFETKTGRPAGDSKLQHLLEITEVAVNQKGPLSERRVAFVDSNADCFLGYVNSYGATRRYEKIGSQISNVHFNDQTNMLAAFRERRVVCWALPNIVFTDRELLARTLVEVEEEDVGKAAFVVGFIGNGVTVRRSDGSLLVAYVPPFLAGLHRCVQQNNWDRALRMCRTVKEEYLWATLAGAAATHKNYRIAEMAYSELLEVEKVYYLREVGAERKEERRMAGMALFNGNVRDAEGILLQAGDTFRAIMINVRMFRFERALELALKHKMHVDTVLGYRKRYLEATGRKENDKTFLRHYADYEIDFTHIRENVKRDLAK